MVRDHSWSHWQPKGACHWEERVNTQLKVQMVWRSPRKEPPAVGTVWKSFKGKAENRVRKWKALQGKVTSKQCPLPTGWVSDFNTPPTHVHLAGTSWDLKLEPWAISAAGSENKFCVHASPCLTLAQKLLSNAEWRNTRLWQYSRPHPATRKTHFYPLTTTRWFSF